MKRIECIVRKDRVEKILNSLLDFDVWGVTLSSVNGCGRQKGYLNQEHKDKKSPPRLLPFVKMEFVVKDEVVESLIDRIIDAGRLNEIGDGKIFISPVLDAIRMRTKERGNEAIGP